MRNGTGNPPERFESSFDKCPICNGEGRIDEKQMEKIVDGLRDLFPDDDKRKWLREHN